MRIIKVKKIDEKASKQEIEKLRGIRDKKNEIYKSALQLEAARKEYERAEDVRIAAKKEYDLAIEKYEDAK